MVNTAGQPGQARKLVCTFVTCATAASAVVSTAHKQAAVVVPSCRASSVAAAAADEADTQAVFETELVDTTPASWRWSSWRVMAWLSVDAVAELQSLTAPGIPRSSAEAEDREAAAEHLSRLKFVGTAVEARKKAPQQRLAGRMDELELGLGLAGKM